MKKEEAVIRFVVHEEGPGDVRGAGSRIESLMESYKTLLSEEAELNAKKKELREEIAKEADGFATVQTPKWTLDFYTRWRQIGMADLEHLEKKFPGITEEVNQIRTKPYFIIRATKEK